MGIQSTKYISRQSAIDRIREVATWIAERNYLALEDNSFEDSDVTKFVAQVAQWQPIDLNLEQWTDRMLEDYMDTPYFRRSMFDNYLIGEDEE